MESPFDVEVFSETFFGGVSTISSGNHPVRVLIFELPEFFFIHIVYLLFGVNSVPEEKVINFFVILAHI